MTRWWTDLLAAVSDRYPLPLLFLTLFLASGVLGLLWYFFPRWVPRHLPRLRWPQWRATWRGVRLGRPRWRWGRRSRPAGAQPGASHGTSGDAELPDLPAQAFVALADRLAAEGRYAEAIRERLRAIVRDLVDHRAVEHRPGWTITELAGAAAAARPAVDAPLGEAARIFSDVWYGLRPAHAEQDTRMRALTNAVAESVGAPAARVGSPA